MQTATKQNINIDSIKAAIASKIDSASFGSWIAPLNFDIVDNTLVLTAHNQFSADFIRGVYTNILTDVAASVGLGLNITVRGATRAAVASANDNRVQTYAPVMAPKAVAFSSSFDAFVMSDENAFVVSAAKKLATGTAAFSPLFIYGPAGCGKSMLAGCIASACERTVMMSGGQFVSEFARSLREHSVFAFKDFCRNCDTFIMDDVQVLSGKRATCEEFIQLVLDLRAAGKNVVLVADAAPANLTGFDRRATSLFASGLVADMVAPTANVRRMMLCRAGVDGETAAHIADRVAANGHLVAGVAMKIKTYTELMGTRVDVNVANKLLADTLARAKTPVAMVKAMCDKMGVSYDAICGSGRARAIVRARQIMMAALKAATKLSLSEIGMACGGRDHATVLYAIAQVEKLKASDLMVAAEIDQMIEECR